MKIDDEKWDQFIKSYVVAILGGLVSGFIVAERGLKLPLLALYITIIVIVGGIIGYILYSSVGKKDKQNIKQKDTNLPQPPPSNPI